MHGSDEDGRRDEAKKCMDGGFPKPSLSMRENVNQIKFEFEFRVQYLHKDKC